MNPNFRPWAMAVLACLTLLTSAPGFAQKTRTIEDNMAERTRACSACHGDQGRAGPDGYYPRLAGKPAGYLYHQLRNFAEGRRHYGLMIRLVDPLSDAYLREIAEHFASLHLPYPAPTPSHVASNWSPGATKPWACPPAWLATASASRARSRMCPACWACRWTTSTPSSGPGKLGNAAPMPPTAWPQWSNDCRRTTSLPSPAGSPASPCPPTPALRRKHPGLRWTRPFNAAARPS